MTNTISGEGFANLSDDVLANMRSYIQQRYAHIVDDARAKVLESVRRDLTELCGVKVDQTNFDDGGGVIDVDFLPGWDEDQAKRFAEQCLDLDIRSFERGPGRYFQETSVGFYVDNSVSRISIRYGLDI